VKSEKTENSSEETQYWLDLLGLSGIIENEKLKDLKQECSELVAILMTTCKRLKDKRK